MNRPIKFRAWDEIGKGMRSWEWCYPIMTRMLDVGSAHILMQFTGLLDKNGKECYEGDVVVIKGRRYEVKWNAEFAMFDPIQDTRLEEFEIIGNIYEIPDLLKP